MEEKYKHCPYCGEEILAVARKCKYCGEWLEDETVKSEVVISSSKEIIKEEMKEASQDKSIYSFFQYYFVDAFIIHYFDFKGKTSRKQYWLGVLTYSLLLLVTSCVGMMISETISLVIQSIVSLLFCIPGLALCVRRLRDIGKNPWWILISVVPIVGVIWILILMCKKGETKIEPVKNKTVDIVIWIISIVLFIVSMVVIFEGDKDVVDYSQSSEAELPVEVLDSESKDVVVLTSPTGIEWTVTPIQNEFVTTYKVHSKFGDITTLTENNNSLDFDIRDFDYNESKLFLLIGADGYGRAMQCRLVTVDLNSGKFEDGYGNADIHNIKLDKKYGIATLYDFDGDKVSEVSYK